MELIELHEKAISTLEDILSYERQMKNKKEWINTNSKLYPELMAEWELDIRVCEKNISKIKQHYDSTLKQINDYDHSRIKNTNML